MKGGRGREERGRGIQVFVNSFCYFGFHGLKANEHVVRRRFKFNFFQQIDRVRLRALEGFGNAKDVLRDAFPAFRVFQQFRIHL